jgi:aldehyde:ferredoxin oxidoreductase
MQPILKVDLTTGQVDEFLVPGQWEEQYLGGASLAARMLYDYLLPDLDPLSPEAPLLFINGPLTGSAGPAVGRFVVAARSPATGLWGESNCGGFWGPELRMTGYDGIWISGRAPAPVYILIHGDRTRGVDIEIREADHIWGLETYQTQEVIDKELNIGKTRVATIGPAGEAKIPMALILTDHGRVAGRTGMGALMGSKNLKAIAVKGTGVVPVSKNGVYQQLRSQANRALRNDAQTRGLNDMGSAVAGDYLDYLGDMPKRYFHEAVFEGASKVTGASVAESILVGVSTCHACVIACGRIVQLEDGKKRKGPEHETLVGFGPNLWIDDPAVITRLGELCDRYGMDVISLSNTIGLAYRLYEMGVINEGDTGGIVLRWGDAEAVEKLIHLTGRKEGIGELIAQGALALGRRYSHEDEAIQVNGLEVPYHDPRGLSGMALVYATSPRGACHNQSDYFMVDIGQADSSLGIEIHSRHGGSEKSADIARHQNWTTVFNALVMCIFANVPPETVLELINVGCNLDLSLDEMLKIGERAWNLKRAINNRLGLRRANDTLPKTLLEPYPGEGGGTEGFVPDLESMLEAYYTYRGWDPDTGFPTPERLKKLNLDFVIKDLWPEKILE